MERIVFDNELGRLIIRVNSRARRFIFRTKSDAIYVTIPPGSTREELEQAIEDLRGKLIESRNRTNPPRLINLDFIINTEFFKCNLVEGNQKRFLAKSEPRKMIIVSPVETDFDDPDLQEWLHKVIKEGLRRNAATMLPNRLSWLSGQYNLPYKSVKVNSSKGRWGSCSTRKNINLSYYLLLLPGHLIDYVLLHELCHTREMNHGERFWALMDTVTQGKSQVLRKELKSYKTEI